MRSKQNEQPFDSEAQKKKKQEVPGAEGEERDEGLGCFRGKMSVEEQSRCW